MAARSSVRMWSIFVLIAALLLLAATVYAIAGSRNAVIDYRPALTLLRQIAQIGAAALVAAVIVRRSFCELRAARAFERSPTILASIGQKASRRTLRAPSAKAGSLRSAIGSRQPNKNS